MEHIKDELKIIINNSAKKRLERELEQLVEGQVIYPESVTINFSEEKTYGMSNYKVCFYTVNKNRYFEFIFSCDYPFKPPKMNLNFKPYSYLHYLKSNSLVFNQKLLKHKKIRCFCCHSKLCNDNWSPAYTMNHIMEEVDTFKNICIEISRGVIIDVIKRKYLNDDINIMEWLF